MAAVLNAQLTAMLTALDGAAAGLGNEFVAHVGSTMAMAAAMPADWFPKTGTPTAAQIASFLMRLHDLKTIVWANYPTAGVTCMADWIVPIVAAYLGGLAFRSMDSSPGATCGEHSAD